MDAQPLYQTLPAHLGDSLQRRIMSLIEPPLAQLRREGVHKVTVSLSAVPQDSIRFKVESDARKAERGIVRTIALPDAAYPCFVHFTRVTNDSSLVPIVELQDTPQFQELVRDIREFFARSLPSHLEMTPDPMSLYLIGTQLVTGPLWRIHSDNCDQRVHVVVSPCAETFHWYEDKEGKREIGSLPFGERRAYILRVNRFHTAAVQNYLEERPRVHLVADLRVRDAH